MNLSHSQCNDLLIDLADLPLKQHLVAILSEINFAEQKHPSWPRDVVHQAAIIAEESGELTQAALEYHYEGSSIDKVRREAVQTAAMAIRLLKNLNR